MVIRMSRPIARPESRHLYARKRIPADIKRILATIPDWPRPAGWGQDEIVISTGPHQLPGETQHDTVARLYANMAATFARLRKGPQDLTDAQISALAGEVYALATSPPPPSAARSKAFSLTSFLDKLIADKGLWLTASARDRLQTAIIGPDGALSRAVPLNAARARGNYETPAISFPAWQDATPAPAASPLPPSKRVSLANLVEQFLTTPRLEDKALGRLTIRKYRTILDRFAGFLANPDARTVTEEDIRRYLHSRLTDSAAPITARTLHKGDLPAIKSLFTWATTRDQHDPVKGPPLTASPAAGIKIKTDADLGITGNEPHWVCRRAQLLRRWSHHEQDDEQILSRSPRACRQVGARQ